MFLRSQHFNVLLIHKKDFKIMFLQYKLAVLIDNIGLCLALLKLLPLFLLKTQNCRSRGLQLTIIIFDITGFLVHSRLFARESLKSSRILSQILDYVKFLLVI